MTSSIIKLIFCIFIIVGYIQCVVKFIQCDFEPSYKAEAIYGISLVTGLGGIVGWMNLGK